jgi:hypothetical protein
MAHAAARGGSAVARALCGRAQLRGGCAAALPSRRRLRSASAFPVFAGIADLFRPSEAAQGRNGRCVASPPAASTCADVSPRCSAPLTKGTVSPRRPVPAHIGRPPYADSGKVPAWNSGYQVQDEQARPSCRSAS